jgi:hypothetical protein
MYRQEGNSKPRLATVRHQEETVITVEEATAQISTNKKSKVYKQRRNAEAPLRLLLRTAAPSSRAESPQKKGVDDSTLSSLCRVRW